MSKKRKIAIALLILIIIGAVSYLGIEAYKLYKQKEKYEALAQFLIENTIDNNQQRVEIDNEIEQPQVVVTPRMEKIKELSKDNSDIVGWIEIPNTTINYPVLKGKDNSFYLNHDYEKNFSTLGSIFLDKDVDIEKPSTNLLMYGHRNKSNMMFEHVYKYRNEAFYKEHPDIRLTTLNSDSEYTIIGAMYAKSYEFNEDLDGSAFKFYNFIEANNEEEFENYINNIKSNSVYNIDETAKYGDELITLCTCEYSQKNGRFIVVAKKTYNIQ